jgi:RNA polymerase sigma-70 factor (ECF subfamily)
MRANLRRQALKLANGNETNADDIVQEAFLLCLEQRDRFTPGTNLGGWAYTVMRNSWLTRLRREKRMQPLNTDVFAEVAAAPDRTDARLDLEQAIAILNANAKASHADFVLRAALGYKIEELAAAEGIPDGTVKSSISRGRDAIRHLR